jgi:hypothetical protein
LAKVTGDWAVIRLKLLLNKPLSLAERERLVQAIDTLLQLDGHAAERAATREKQWKVWCTVDEQEKAGDVKREAAAAVAMQAHGVGREYVFAALKIMSNPAERDRVVARLTHSAVFGDAPFGHRVISESELWPENDQD